MPFNAQAFAHAAEQPAWGDAPPDGLYELLLYETQIYEAQTDGRDWLRLKFRVLEGAHRDHEFSINKTIDEHKADGSDNGDALRFTIELLKGLGIAEATIAAMQTKSDLRRELDKIEGRSYRVDVRASGRFTNLTVQSEQLPVPPPTGYGRAPEQRTTTPQPPPGPRPDAARPANAITQGDVPESAGTLNLPTEQRRDLERTGESDVPGAQGDEFKHPPQQGEVDPETGEPIPF